MKKLMENYAELPRAVRRPLWRLWHSWIINREKKGVAMTCMNYGYADLGNPETIELEPEDESERYGVQLYNQAVSWVDLKGRRVLEVGSGRGGGGSFVARYLQPESYVGLDLSEPGIRFCNAYHTAPNLRFVHGDAEDIPFEDDSFDAVVNVESSRCYPHIERFFAEVKRVLRPDGDFLLTDMRWKDDVENLRRKLDEAGFQLVSEKPIRENVVRALDIDDDRKLKLIQSRIPRFLLKTFAEFAGTRGSGRYEAFASGDMEYWSFHLRHK